MEREGLMLVDSAVCWYLIPKRSYVAYGIMISYCDQYFLVKYSEAAAEGTL